ncbi:helix-turn-helix domain-containing protein [Streptacidiphilus griseoplanus]|uniref:helix-turn-helix domain-containing protein n=1 Tax=Peterkaempfera griseoplana TaxID=66896 RepID=UPI0006E3A826|nr:pyridoxamine 5'-phosphate oxidase family protein [Peterkaempfera griseoplana]
MAVSEKSAPSHGAPEATAGPPGDMAGRVARHCAALGISTEELARRAGMSPRYLELLEELGGDFDPAGLARIADALHMSPRELLEGPAGRRPGTGPAARRPHLGKLNPDECRDRLGTHGVGRVAVVTPEGTAVLPVNYTVLAGTVVYRTDPDAVTAAAPGAEIAFEVDDVDDTWSSGWSVLVVGTVEHVSDPDVVRVLSEQAVAEPWAGGKRELWVRLNPIRVTGRVIRVD